MIKSLHGRKALSSILNAIVETKLEYFCLWSINNKCAFDENNGITTNQSEGFNFLLKDFQNWKEVPLDCLMMSSKLIQGFYFEECRRGKAGLGNFCLKPKYVKFMIGSMNLGGHLKLALLPRTLVGVIVNIYQSNFRVIKHGTQSCGPALRCAKGVH